MLFYCLYANIYFCLETSGGQSSNLYLNVVHFSPPVLIRHLWQLKTVAFLHWCLICAILLFVCKHFLLETSSGQSSNLYLNVVHFSPPVLIRHLWQFKKVVFLHWCLNLCYSHVCMPTFSLTWRHLVVKVLIYNNCCSFFHHQF